MISHTNVEEYNVPATQLTDFKGVAGPLTGSIISGVSFTTGHISDTALLFPGSPASVRGESAIVTEFPFSVSFWAKIYDVSTGQAIFWQGDKDQNNNDAFEIGALAAGNARLIFWSGGTAFIADSAGQVDDGLWHHYAAVYDSTTDKRLYMDGSLIVTLGSECGINAGSHDRFSFGLDADSATEERWFSGCLDEVRVYDSNVTDWIGSLRENKHLPSGLISYWNMENATGSSVHNSTTANFEVHAEGINGQIASIESNTSLTTGSLFFNISGVDLSVFSTGTPSSFKAQPFVYSVDNTDGAGSPYTAQSVVVNEPIQIVGSLVDGTQTVEGVKIRWL